MRSFKSTRGRPALAAGLAAVAMTLGSAAPAEAAEKIRYVALGDSYASGQGAGPYADSCFRSEAAYSELADEMRSVKLVRNVACSGNTTQDVVDTQLRRLSKNTDLVTITAGGNNLRVGDLFRYCGAAILDLTASPLCDRAAAFAATEIGSRRLAADVAAMIRSVKAAAPNARVVVTGYPYLYDPVTAGGNDPVSPFLARATELVDGLNGSIAAAARAEGAHYVDVRAAFAGHGINSADPWITLDLAQPSSADNFHPNADGYGAYFAALTAAGVFTTR